MNGTGGAELGLFQGVFRFGLELAAFTAWAVAAWSVMPSTVLSVLAAVAAVLVTTAAWGTFRVPGDASASGGAPVAVGGGIRFVLELVILLGGAVAVAATGSLTFGVVLGALVVLHYATTPARTRWLLDGSARSPGGG